MGFDAALLTLKLTVLSTEDSRKAMRLSQCGKVRTREHFDAKVLTSA